MKTEDITRIDELEAEISHLMSLLKSASTIPAKLNYNNVIIMKQAELIGLQKKLIWKLPE